MMMGGVIGTVTPAVAVLLPFAFVAVSVNVVVVVTVTMTLPMVTGDTGPTPWSMERLVAPVTFQASVTVPPPTGRVDGVAVKLLMVGGGPPTTTRHCLLVLLPVVPVAVSVKVVDAVTLTEVLPAVGGFTTPTPLSMERLTAPLTFQASVTLPPPNGSVDGVHVKPEMVGVGLPLLGQPASATASNAVRTTRVETICIPPQ